MPHYQTAIIIPVFNQWLHTRNCLKALSATLREKSAQIIVVDNASGDVTPAVCPELGRNLFGNAFCYIRQERNINFGPASNAGAIAADADFLLFLNNDTVPLPGWYEPLLDDFSRFPRLGATGPLLLYPPQAPLGYTIQHLGVYVSPFRKVAHLYEGIPANSPLASKRRFFQVITAACMLVPRNLFLQMGMFDENYRNGFEDVDFCAKLSASGKLITVNPEARVIHFQGQSAGRHDAESHNSSYFTKTTRELLTPDWHKLVKADGLMPTINQWQELQPLAADQSSQAHSQEQILDAIASQPYNRDNWRQLGRMYAGRERLVTASAVFRLFPGADTALAGYEAARQGAEAKTVSLWFNTLTYYCRTLDFYKKTATRKQQQTAEVPEISQAFAKWLKNSPKFASGCYAEFMDRLWKIHHEDKVHLSPWETWAYTLWTYRQGKMVEKAEITQASGPKFVILVPDAGSSFQELLLSLENQQYAHWQAWIRHPEDFSGKTKDSRINRYEDFEAAALDENARILLLAPDTILADYALNLIAQALARSLTALLLYGDADRILPDGACLDPFFRTGWKKQPPAWRELRLAVLDPQRFGSLELDPQGMLSCSKVIDTYATSLTADQIAHIPHILCHCHVEHKAWQNLGLPEHSAGSLYFHAIASPKASFSLIFYLEEPVPPQFPETWLANFAYPPELIICGQPKFLENIPSQIRTIPTSQPFRAAITEGATLATGQILGCFSAPITPVNSLWTEVIAGQLHSPDIGATAGMILKDGRLLDTGCEAGANGRIEQLFKGCAENEPIYHGINMQPRRVAAVNTLSLFTAKKTWQKLGGFGAELTCGIFEDYCCRLAQEGYSIVWDPAAAFQLAGRLPIKRLREAAQEVNNRWAGKILPFNPCLNINNGQFTLSD